MSSWNYRILCYPDGSLGLHEVHYAESGEVSGYATHPADFVCHGDEGPDGVLESLAMAITDARRLPPLVKSELDTQLDIKPSFSPGRIAFEAYNADRGGVNYQGLKTPDWPDLTEGIRHAWEVAALAVTDRK